MGSILLLPPSWDAMGRCPLRGRAGSPQEGIAARLLQAPGHVRGWCISGAGSSPMDHLKVESRGSSARGSLRWCWAGEAALTLDPISFLMALMQGMTGEELPSPAAGPCPRMGGL